jgi:hypothetical protein
VAGSCCSSACGERAAERVRSAASSQLVRLRAVEGDWQKCGRSVASRCAAAAGNAMTRRKWRRVQRVEWVRCAIVRSSAQAGRHKIDATAAVWKKKKKTKKATTRGLTGRCHGVDLDRANQTDRRLQRDQTTQRRAGWNSRQVYERYTRHANEILKQLSAQRITAARARRENSVHRFIFSCFCSVRIFLRR